MDKIITNTNDATWWTNIQLIQVAPTGGRIFKAKGATWWPNFQIIQVARPGGQIFNKRKWRHLVAKFPTITSGVTWWQNFDEIQKKSKKYCASDLREI